MTQLPGETTSFDDYSCRTVSFISSNCENRHIIEENKNQHGFLRFINFFIQQIFTEHCVHCVEVPMMGRSKNVPQSQEI